MKYEVYMKSIIILLFLSLIFTGCQKPAVSIQPPEKEDGSKKDQTDKQQQALIDDYIEQVEKEQNIDEESLTPTPDNPQEYLENLIKDSRINFERDSRNSNNVQIINDPQHSRFNNSTYAKSLGSRLLSLQEETAKTPMYNGHQSFNDHILTQLLQGISFSVKAITPNEAIQTYKQFLILNLFPHYDEAFWKKIYQENDPYRNIEFFESAAVLTKTSLISGFSPLKLYEDYFAPIKRAYNIYFDLDNDFELLDYLAIAYLTEQYVFYKESTGLTAKTEGDFVSLVDNYNCQFDEEYINGFFDKILCYKAQSYTDSSQPLAQSLHSPDINKVEAFTSFDLKGQKVTNLLSQLNNDKLWGTTLTSRSKLKLAGLMVWSNTYKEDNGQSVIESFKSNYEDLIQSEVATLKLKLNSQSKKDDIRYELKYALNDKNYSEVLFDLDQHEEIQAIAIELTRTSFGLY